MRPEIKSHLQTGLESRQGMQALKIAAIAVVVLIFITLISGCGTRHCPVMNL